MNMQTSLDAVFSDQLDAGIYINNPDGSLQLYPWASFVAQLITHGSFSPETFTSYQVHTSPTAPEKAPAAVEWGLEGYSPTAAGPSLRTSFETTSATSSYESPMSYEYSDVSDPNATSDGSPAAQPSSSDSHSRPHSSQETDSPDSFSVSAKNSPTAGMTTSLATDPLHVYLDSITRRVLNRTANKDPEARIVTFQAGTWYRVWQEGLDGSEEVWPWSGNGNMWLKGQLKEMRDCSCGFSFRVGGTMSGAFKRPSVTRDHLATCCKLHLEDPLVLVCRFMREVDRSVRAVKESRGKKKWYVKREASPS